MGLNEQDLALLQDHHVLVSSDHLNSYGTDADNAEGVSTDPHCLVSTQIYGQLYLEMCSPSLLPLEWPDSSIH